MNPKQAKRQRRKNTAQVVCPDESSFWTTQAQFWDWVRAGAVRKVSDPPLTGLFVRGEELRLVLRNHTVLNLAAPKHLAEVVKSRRLKR